MKDHEIIRVAWSAMLYKGHEHSENGVSLSPFASPTHINITLCIIHII